MLNVFSLSRDAYEIVSRSTDYEYLRIDAAGRQEAFCVAECSATVYPNYNTTGKKTMWNYNSFNGSLAYRGYFIEREYGV